MCTGIAHAELQMKSSRLNAERSQRLPNRRTAQHSGEVDPGPLDAERAVPPTGACSATPMVDRVFSRWAGVKRRGESRSGRGRAGEHCVRNYEYALTGNHPATQTSL